MTNLAVHPATELPGPPEGQLPALLPVPARSVPLTRLVGLARLTPPQALEVATGLLAAAVQQAGPDLVSVAVDADGRVLLDSSAGGGTLAAVLAEVVAAARVGARRPDPAAADLLDLLDRAAADLPGAGVPAVAATLQEAAAAIDRPGVRAELGALVRAVDRQPEPVRGGAPAGGRPARARAGIARPAPRARSRTGLRRIGAWVLSVVVLAAVVLLEVGLLRDRIAADIGLLLDAGRSGSAPSEAPAADGRPVVPPAPAAAGSVTGVDLRALGECAPGGPCTVRLLVQLVPGAGPREVTWSYQLVDRCTGAATVVPGGAVTVLDGSDRAAAVGTVVLPPAPAVAVLAVTDLPAAAASAPVLVGSCLPAPAG